MGGFVTDIGYVNIVGPGKGKGGGLRDRHWGCLYWGGLGQKWVCSYYEGGGVLGQTLGILIF